jgi:hypothetical protein
MAIISISEAAKTWRIARSTLQRAVREGRLSITTKTNGSRGIDTAELVRVFGEPSPAALHVALHAALQPNAAPDQASAAAQGIAALQAQVAALQEQLQEARQREAAALERETAALERERWLRGLIEHQQQRLPPPAPPKPGFFRRLFGWSRKPSAG